MRFLLGFILGFHAAVYGVKQMIKDGVLIEASKKEKQVRVFGEHNVVSASGPDFNFFNDAFDIDRGI